LEPGAVIPAKLLKGECNIDIEMSDSFAEDLSVNNVRNLKAPLTPIAWIEMDNAKGTPVLAWNPIEYIAGLRCLKTA